MNTAVEAAVENMIMYIPVALLTMAGNPISRRIGLKIAPPPRPKAPATHPPAKATIKS